MSKVGIFSKCLYKKRWHIKRIDDNRFICHLSCHFSVSSHTVLSSMSCRFSYFIPVFFHHQYGICCMYSKEDPQDFRLPVPCLYLWERVMLYLNAEASFKPGDPFFWQFTSEHLSQELIPGRPSLAHIPSFVQNLLLALLAYMESPAAHLTLTFMSSAARGCSPSQEPFNT